MDERTGLKNVVNRYLKTLEPDVFWEKRWGGGLYTKSGVSDYTGIAWGVPFALEIKHPNKRGTVSPDQVVYQHRFERAGGRVAVAASLGEVTAFFDRLRPK